MLRITAAIAATALGLAFLVSGRIAAQADVVERPFPAGGTVILELSAGDYEIIGKDDNRIRIDWRRSDSRRVNVDVDVKGNQAEIWIDGPATKGAEALIELPRRTHLVVKLSAGDLDVRGIDGNKNISARAGELDIQVGSREQYRRVDASVNIGELSAPGFDVSKGGFFRSFTWAGKGPYEIRAHLTVGELRLAP